MMHIYSLSTQEAVQKGCRFKVSLNCIVSPHLKTNKNTSIICHCYLRPCFLKSSTGPYLKVPQSGMYISVVEGLPSIQKALDLIYSSTPNSFFSFFSFFFFFFSFLNKENQFLKTTLKSMTLPLTLF